MARSGVAWAIVCRGNIVLERRFLQALGDGGPPIRIVSASGLSGPGDMEVAAALRGNGVTVSNAYAMGGPLWRRKQDAMRFCRRGEWVAKVRVYREAT